MFNYFLDVYVAPGQPEKVVSEIFFALLLAALFGNEKFNKHTIVDFVLCFLFCYVVNFVYVSLFYWIFSESDYGYLITPLFTAFTTALLWRKVNVIDRIIRVCIYVSLCTFSSALLFPIVCWERQFDWNTLNIFSATMRAVMFAAIIFLLYKQNIGKLKNVSPNFVVLMIAITFIGYVTNVVMVAILNIPKDTPFSFNFFSSLAMLIVEVLSYVMFYSLSKEFDSKQILLMETQRMHSENSMLKVYETAYDDIRIVRHDIQNQYSYLKAMLLDGKYDKATQYLEELGATVLQDKGAVLCENRIMNLLLNLALEKAQKQDIKMEFNVSLPKKINLPETSLVSIMTNLLDNSRDACKQLPISERVVSVTATIQNDFLLLRVTNPVKSDMLKRENGTFVSTKRDLTRHGFGTRIIRKIAESCNGCCDFNVENNIFIADVMLKLEGNIEDELN